MHYDIKACCQSQTGVVSLQCDNDE